MTDTFTYTRDNYIIKAYGREYELPVRTTAFCDSLDAADREIAAAAGKKSADVISAVKKGIDVFIGEGEAEKLFPADADTDTDEIFAFYDFLKKKSLDNLRTYTAKYAPSAVIRR